MKQIEVLPGSSSHDAFEKAYNAALRGESGTFKFNGVRVVLFRDQ